MKEKCFCVSYAYVLVLTLCLMLSACPGGGSGKGGWTYDVTGSQVGHRIFPTSERGFLVFGEGLRDGSVPGTVHLRLSADGRTLAKGVIGSLLPATPEGGEGPSVAGALLAGGDFVLAGMTLLDDPELNETRLRVIRINSGGEILWDYQYGEEELTPQVVLESPWGDLFIAGNRTWAGFLLDVFFLHLAPDGEIAGFQLLERLEDRSNFTIIKDAAWLGEDAFVLTGRSSFDTNGDGQTIPTVSLVKVSTELEVLWWERIGIDLVRSPASVRLSPEGIAVVAQNLRGPERPILIKTDFDGNVVATRDDIFTQGNSGERGTVYDFIVDAAGDIVMVGEGVTVEYAGIFPRFTYRAFISKLTADGDKIWDKSINHPGALIYGVTERPGGGYATVGTTPGRRGDLLNVILFDNNGRIVN